MALKKGTGLNHGKNLTATVDFILIEVVIKS